MVGWGQDGVVGVLGVGWGQWGWDIRLRMGFQTQDGVPVRDEVPDKGWGSRHEDGGFRQGVEFLIWGGVADKGCGTRHRWGSRHGIMGYQTDDGVSVRGGVTTFTSHQSGILHSLIFCSLKHFKRTF